MKLRLDQQIIRSVNLYRFINSRAKRSAADKHALLQSKNKLQGLHLSSAAIIIGNGPSFETLAEYPQLSDTCTLFTCNRAYLSPIFKALSPTFHLIIDDKLPSGVWPSDMVDNIHKVSPNTFVILDVSWRNTPYGKKYWDNSRVLWIEPLFFPSYYAKYASASVNTQVAGLNVSLAAVSLAASMRFKDLGLLGIEGDGIFREILDRPSHFYADDQKDISLSSYDSMIESLELAKHTLYAWKGIVKNLEHSGISVCNLSPHGILDVCPRASIDSFLSAA